MQVTCLPNTTSFITMVFNYQHTWSSMKTLRKHIYGPAFSFPPGKNGRAGSEVLIETLVTLDRCSQSS